MKKNTHIRAASKTAILASIACFAFGTVSADILPLRFDDGNGTSSVDQFAGTGGDGWAGGWVSRNPQTDNMTTNVVNTNPLTTGGGNYLSVSGSSGTSGNDNRFYNIGRQYNDSTGLALDAYHEVSFEFRLDSVIEGRLSHVNTYFNFMDRPGTVTGDLNDFGGDGRWLIRNYPGTAGPTGTGQANFLLYDGEKDGGGFNTDRFVDSGVTLNLEDVYRFTILLNPEEGEWQARIQNLTANTDYLSDVLGFRTDATSASGELLFGFRDRSGGVNPTYSFDNVTVAIPEPGTLVLLGIAGVAGLIGFRRRKR
ncbi:MAG: PEP-CTERM sorting domain-containing protein [Verrucomicrobia bacterium]|nr:PEP-CTERM sorting domain-containing protein [Verrucomicrobiota bacterium]MCH8512472.1 PEP-CTERM sorting domain-containing protein [Kiritimatiellia bacterium]